MPIPAGTRLGPYEILSAIGAGGMGEVYRARDARLNRSVAIKILPSHLAEKPELRERFEREARTIASLNHPHICVLYDIGHQDGADFLVLEYLEGETLAERLKKGPLPLEEALRYAIEIADALDKAHRKGITHRDLKPGNIMLTKAGTKLLDFGLAKLTQGDHPATPFSELPTQKDGITAEGTILGTLQYMAPEQVEGKEADARTDIFAFGVVVYEMATGKKAFEGKSQASLIAKIMETEPAPISSLQPMTPPALDRLVKKCLSKEPEKRWQAASDLCDELKWIAEGGSQVETSTPVVTTRTSPLGNIRVAWSVGAVALFALILVLIVGAFAYFRREPERSIRFSISLPATWNLAQLPIEGMSPAPLAISPDGQRLAFLAVNAEDKSVLWVRPLDALTAQMLPGTEGASQPFWSPDSRFLAFFANGKLKKIDVSGGPPITLCEAPLGESGGWSRNGTIIFAGAQTGSPIRKVSASGGEPTVVLTLSQGETSQARPVFLPDGRHFLYRGSIGPEGVPIYLASLDSAKGRLLFHVDAAPVRYSQGHLLFLRERTLMAQPFDLKKLEFTGDAFPIAEQIQTSQTTNPNAFFSASENGVLAYQTGPEAAGTRLVWFDRSGKQIDTLGEAAAYAGVELSPDGKQVGVGMLEGGKRAVWFYDVVRQIRTRFTFDPALTFNPVWSPDGRRVVFNSRVKGHLDLYQKAASGAGSDELLFEDNVDKFPDSWSGDGKFIMYTGISSAHWSLFVLPLSGDRKPFPFLNTKFNEAAGQFSPDGRWVAYSSDESGRPEVYVAPFPGPGGKRQISTAGGNWPRWRHDGSEIFYLARDSKLMAAPVNGNGSNFEVGTVKPLFETRAVFGLLYGYAVSTDGQRFLINMLREQMTSNPITVVLNWTAGLNK